MINDTCPMCGMECKIVVVPVSSVTWGNDEHPSTYNGVQYGSFTFDIYDDEYYGCSNEECMKEFEGFYTFEQAQAQNVKVNEWIKTNLGIDWLAENEKRRARRKANGGGRRSKKE